MSQKFKSELELEALNNASTDTDKFLVSDNGIIKYRTGIELLNDINGQSLLTNPITGTGTINKLPKFTGSGTLGNSQIFDNGTNVGIGTSSPIHPLSVLGKIGGSIYGDSFVEFTESGNTIVKANDDVVIGYSQNVAIKQNGSVGIGTTNPGARLDIRAQGALSTDIAFRVRNSTDTGSFLVVNGAGDVYNNGAGGINSNTFFGENVGRNITGVNNTGFGVNVLSSATKATGNSAFGVAALRLTTGISNSAFGSSALEKNTTGFGNSAFGLGSLFNNTTGAYNTAFGFDSLFNIVDSNYGIGIGMRAGKFISDGITSLTKADYSIFIGDNTRASANNQTNQIVIGSNAIGDGSNSVVLGNSSITRTRLQGQVIIASFATAPTGIEGAIYYNSTNKKHYGFNGTTWNALY